MRVAAAAPGPVPGTRRAVLATVGTTARVPRRRPSERRPAERRPRALRADAAVIRRALSATVAVACSDAELRAAVAAALGALPPAVDAGHRYVLARHPSGTVDVHRDGEAVACGVSAGEAVDWLVWDCTRLAVAATPHLLLHAGAVAGRRGAVVLPGPSGAGKSTLVGALVRGGYDYLTDELVALDGGARALPFPRGLGLDARARRLLGGLDHVPTPHVPPDALRPAAVSGARPVVAVVVPRYEPGGRSLLQPLPVDRAVLALATAAVNLPAHGTGGLRSLATLASRCPCYELQVGDVATALAALASVVAP